MKKFIAPLFVIIVAFIALPKGSVQNRIREQIDSFTPTVETSVMRVERIVDGDTIRLSNGETVRLIGVDAPESKANAKAKRDAERTGSDVQAIKKMGKEVTNFVKDVLKEGDEVLLEFDTQKSDRYGRLLAYVYRQVEDYRPGKEDASLEPFLTTACVEQNTSNSDCAQWLMLNAELIFDGYVQPMTITPNVRYADSFKDLQHEARSKERGFWDNRAWRLDPKNQDPLSSRK